MQLKMLLSTLQELAPLDLAEDWDNVGLLLGDDAADVSAVMTCLTLTPDVAEEAVREHVGLVVTHHPLMFKPVQRISSATSEGAMIVSLLKHGVAVYSPHTAWDNAPQGINQQLAELLELQNIKPLRPRPCEEQVQIVTFVPIDHRLAVQKALWDAGAGVIGDYRECSYHVSGTGTFYGTESAHPTIGQKGRLEQVAEDRLEVVCPAHLLSKALERLRQAHPYEEPAIDVYPRRSLPSNSGAGRTGDLPQPMPLGGLNRLVCERLKTPVTPFVGEADQMISRLGIACGAAAEFARNAQRAGCQVLLTGEARFHACLEARTSGFGLIIPGHYATERPGTERLAELLAIKHAELNVVASRVECDPLGWE
jgi:dinuclear metal center YbgI/SA1388 family protein